MKLKNTCIILIMILLLGCAKAEYPDKMATDFFTITEKKQNEAYVYNPYLYELCVYNADENSYRGCFGQNELLEYCFELSTEFDYVSVGAEDTFYVFHCQENGMEDVYKEENGYIVPFATDGTNFYYILNQINGEHAIVIINEGKLETVTKLGDRAVEGGVIHNNCLYYSSYIEATDNYEIFEYNLSSKSEKIIKKNVESGDLYVLNDEILFSSSNVIYNDAREIRYKGLFVKIIDEYDILVEWDVDKDSNYLLRFTDIDTGEKIASVTGGINYVLGDKVIYVYSHHGVEEILLSEE